MKEFILKIIGVFFTVLVLVNFVLFVFGVIDMYMFWIMLGICALVAMVILPALRKKFG